MPSRLNWDDFRLIQAISETGTLAGAADRLGLNHSTIFRRLGALEEQTGVKLFERARVGYQPTQAGADMVDTAQRMATDISDFERRLVGCSPTPAGELKVATNDALAAYVLPPLCAAFRALYPELRLDLIVGNSASNLSRREADVAIRATHNPVETLVGRRIAEIGWGLYAAPSVIERYGSPEAPDAPWIGFGDALRALPVAREIEATIGEERVAYRTSTMVGRVEATAAGLGFAPIPAFIAEGWPGVVRVKQRQNEGRGLWLLTHSDLRQSARVRAFMDFFGAELTRLRPRFEWPEGDAEPVSAS